MLSKTPKKATELQKRIMETEERKIVCNMISYLFTDCFLCARETVWHTDGGPSPMTSGPLTTSN